jgi:hypothetical protein
LLITLFADLMDFGIGAYLLTDALIFAVHNITLWIVIGLVVAWRMNADSQMKIE